MNRAYAPEFKAKVILEATTVSINSAAKNNKLARTTVQKWVTGAGIKRQLATPKRETLDDLVYEFLYEGLKTLTVQLRHFRSADWLQKQGAGDIYLLFGTAFDKISKTAAALERSRDDQAGMEIDSAASSITAE